MWKIYVNNIPFGHFSTKSPQGMKLLKRREIAESCGFHNPSDKCSHTFVKDTLEVRLEYMGEIFIQYTGQQAEGEYPEGAGLSNEKLESVEELIWAFQDSID